MISKVMTTPKLTRSIPNCLGDRQKDGYRDDKDGIPLQKTPEDQHDENDHCQDARGCGAHVCQRKDDLIRNLLMNGQPAEKAGRSNNKEQADGLFDRKPEDLREDLSALNLCTRTPGITHIGMQRPLLRSV